MNGLGLKFTSTTPNAKRAYIGADLADTHERLKRWAVEAEEAVIVLATNSEGEPTVTTPDWRARTSVVQQLLNSTKLFADLLERIYATDQVRQFQESVLECVEEADPATAIKLRDKLAAKRSVRQAALLGIQT